MALSNPQEAFGRLFAYDAEAGRLINRCFRSANAREGQEAGFDNGNGYRRVNVAGKQYYAHHIIWVLANGAWPEGELDHIDGDTQNNRIENLRACDRFGNNQNTSKRAHSQQPFKGVQRNRNGRWIARIVANKTMHRLGAYATAEEAHAAYCQAAQKLHGEFARVA